MTESPEQILSDVLNITHHPHTPCVAIEALQALIEERDAWKLRAEDAEPRVAAHALAAERHYRPEDFDPITGKSQHPPNG